MMLDSTFGFMYELFDGFEDLSGVRPPLQRVTGQVEPFNSCENTTSSGLNWRRI
jgi:hypothetical protein